MAEYAADPARLADLSARIAAFRLACAFERLKGAGRLEDVFIDDPFDPEAEVSVKLTEARWQSANRDSPPGRLVRAELACLLGPAVAIRGPARGHARFGVAGLVTLGFVVTLTLGYGAGHFGFRAYSLWVAVLAHFGPRGCHFGLRSCSLWATGLAHFGPRISCRISSKSLTLRPFMEQAPLR